MATLREPFALDRSLNTTESPSRNIADVLAEELSAMITAIGGLNFINFVVVAELPTTGISTTTIYLVPSDDPQSENTYDEYINLNGTVSGWEKIGSTDIDLSGYYTSAEVDDLLADKADVSDIPTVNDGTLTIQQNGDTKGTFTANQSGNSTVNIEIPTTDIQTAVDEFETFNGGLLSSLKVALSPNQNLHGYAEPWVGGASDNLLPLTVDGIKALNTDGTWNGNEYTWRGITYTILTDDGNNVIGINSNGTASEIGWLFIADKHFDDNDVTFGGSVYASTANYSYYCGFTNQDAYIYYNSSSNKSYILIANGYTTNNQKWYPIVRTKTTEAPTFSPYSNICPISGHTEARLDDVGKNKADPSTLEVGYYSTTGYNSSANFKTTAPISVEVGKTYFGKVFNTNDLTEKYDVVYTTFSSDDTTNALRQVVSGSITIQSGEKYVRIRNNSDHTPLIQSGNFAYQLELGSTATPYEPYLGKSYVTPLGTTIYMANIDMVSGGADVVGESVKGSSLTWIDASAGGYQRFRSSATLANAESNEYTVDLLKCSKFDTNRNAIDALDADGICIYGKYIYVRSKTTTSLAEFQTLIADADICYTYATPQHIQLSPQLIQTLVGENNLSAPLEGQEITESKYKQMFTFDDVIAYIQSLS